MSETSNGNKEQARPSRSCLRYACVRGCVCGAVLCAVWSCGQGSIYMDVQDVCRVVASHLGRRLGSCIGQLQRQPYSSMRRSHRRSWGVRPEFLRSSATHSNSVPNTRHAGRRLSPLSELRTSDRRWCRLQIIKY